ncbi:MAG: energy-coupling factor ABC transporter ATP-binding protein [Clostridiales bacterium]|nr:energy-coupling factor ABC transporter ATP-binding protein [Clostridiales bacterium]
MIRLENVSFGYGQTQTLHDINLTVEKGSFTAVVGENGAGKSTLLRLIRGLLKPDSGSVFIDGRDINGKKVKISALAKDIGFLFQNPDRQLCKGTVRDELMFTLTNVIKDKEECQRLCGEALSDFGFNGDDVPFEMSRGEKQKVALASTIVSKPKILILDEPTTGLNFIECTDMMNRIKALNEKGCTVVMVCHDMEVVLDYADKAVIMDKGRITAEGKVRDIFYDEDVLKKSAVLPPQIIGLSQMLGNPYGRVYTPEEMAQAVGKKRSVEK